MSYPTSIPDDEHVAAIVAELGVPESEARMILALERREIDGDLVPADSDD